MTIKIIPNEKGNPPGKLADAELHFDAGHGVLAGLKLIGFAIWERRTGAGRNVTFGSVFLCRHTETGEGAAIKTLQVEPLSNPQQRDAMLREAELWASLPLHPNVVSCDFLFNSVQDHRLWLGMERVDGDPVRGATLWEWTTGEPLDVERLVRVVGGICAAMQHVANANMVHRDLKPGNVLAEAVRQRCAAHRTESGRRSAEIPRQGL